MHKFIMSRTVYLKTKKKTYVPDDVKSAPKRDKIEQKPPTATR